MSLQALSIQSGTPDQFGLPQPIFDAHDRAPMPSVSGLAELVHHRDQVDAQAPLAEVHKLFQNHPGDYRAIVDGTRVVGLCSRATVGFVLGSRYGFALYASNPVITVQAPRPLVHRWDAPLPGVLDQALSRTGSEFFEDLILVDQQGALVGLVPVPSLARLQLRLFGEQLNRVVAQDQELRQHNLDLFQINQQLRQSQGRYKVLFENNALGIALLDTKGAVVAHNLRFEQLVRLNERPAPAPFTLGQWICQEDQPAWLALLSQHEREAPKTEPKVTAFRFDLPDGPRLFELHTNWVVETGQTCVFLEDITEKHSLEQRMAEQEKQSMLDTLVAGVAHELNNKLTPVMGFAELLDALAPAHLQAHTRCIRQSAEEAAQIIRQLLSLSRPSSSASVLFDAGAIAQDALQILGFQLRDAACEVSVHLAQQPAYVQGDPVQLKQVLINLILNAIHAMEGRPKSQLALRLSLDAGSVWLRVRDNGIGIKREILSRIFDPFFTTKGPRGTGLGLSISSSIIRQQGGELSVESTPGQGATFTIRLPSGHPGAKAAAIGERAAELPAPHAASRRRVLVVDDEEFVRQFMQEALRKGFGCCIETADDGVEAMLKLTEASYDMILSDIRMPRMDGIQLLSWLALHRPELAERMVFVTGHASTIELDQSLDRLRRPVIRKPFKIETIISTCRPYLQGVDAVRS